MKQVRRSLELADVPPVETKAHIETRTTPSGLSLDVSTVELPAAHPGQTPIVNLLPWSEYVARPDATDRHTVMARALGARFISIDNLGVGDGTSGIPTGFRKDIRNGNFDAIAEAQWEALLQDESVRDMGRVSLLGYSLGAAMGASLAKTAPAGMMIERFIMWESAGVTPQSVPRFAAKFGAGALRSRQYFGENPDWMHQPGSDKTFATRMRTAPAGYVSYPMGLAKGRALDDLREARVAGSITRDTEFVVLHGENSRVSTAWDNIALAEELQRSGLSVAAWEVHEGESHGVIDSTRRVTDALKPYATAV